MKKEYEGRHLISTQSGVIEPLIVLIEVAVLNCETDVGKVIDKTDNAHNDIENQIAKVELHQGAWEHHCINGLSQPIVHIKDQNHYSKDKVENEENA